MVVLKKTYSLVSSRNEIIIMITKFTVIKPNKVSCGSTSLDKGGGGGVAWHLVTRSGNESDQILLANQNANNS